MKKYNSQIHITSVYDATLMHTSRSNADEPATIKNQKEIKERLQKPKSLENNRQTMRNQPTMKERERMKK